MFESAIAAILSGGATGLLGSVFGQIGDYFKTKEETKREAQRQAHEREQRKLDLEQTRMEIEGRARIAETEADRARDVAAYAALTESFGADRATYATGDRARNSAWFIAVDVFRGFTRPGVTWYMAGLQTYMFVAFVAAIGGLSAALTHAELAGIVRDIVNTVLFTGTTCTLWWFGSRGKSEARK